MRHDIHRTYILSFLEMGMLLLFMLGVFGCDDSARQHAESTNSPPLDPWKFEHIIIDNDPPASYRINDIQIADINSDGKLDIWTSGRGSGANAYQMVWYQNPSWTRYKIAPGDYKYGNIGDIDGDGDQDIIVGQRWFENPGNPEHAVWPEHPLGYTLEPDLVHIGDINGDQRPDIVFTTKHELYWLPNPQNPASTWTSFLIYKESDILRTGGTVADIDSDGDLDIVWGNAWFENPSEPRTSPWTKHIIDPTWPAEARGAVGDVDGDGKPEIVLSGEESSMGVAWYKAPSDVKTDQWIKKEVVSSGYEGVHSLVLADFDQDGDLDIFAAEMHSGANPDKVAIFENIDIESNIWREHIIATSGSHNAKVADLNGDGYPDIVGKNYQAGEIPLRVEAWINRGVSATPLSLSWPRHIIDASRPWQAVFIESGDINGDHFPDIITGGWWYQNPGDPKGSWKRHEIGDMLHNMAVVYDFDGDGDLDVLGTRGKVKSNQFVWAENMGNGTFRQHQNIPEAKGDFLQGARVLPGKPGGQLRVVLSWHNSTSTQIFSIPDPPNGPWTWMEISQVTNGEQIAIGDIDHDGDSDIHLGTTWLKQENGNWISYEEVTLGDPEADPDRVELADIDQDGDLDVVIGCEHANRVVWGESPVNPETPWKEHIISTDILAMSLDVGDVDGDGDPDIVVGEHNQKESFYGRVLLYQNLHRGTAWNAFTIDEGLEHHDGTRFVDIDNDGDLDVISIGWTHNWVVLYENTMTPRRDNQ